MCRSDAPGSKRVGYASDSEFNDRSTTNKDQSQPLKSGECLVIYLAHLAVMPKSLYNYELSVVGVIVIGIVVCGQSSCPQV